MLYFILHCNRRTKKVFQLFFHPEVLKELENLEPENYAKIIFLLEKLKQKGNLLRYPDSRLIRDGLFELRTGNKDITRTFFAFAKGKKIYILRVFVKKTKKTPESEIILSFKRLSELS